MGLVHYPLIAHAQDGCARQRMQEDGDEKEERAR